MNQNKKFALRADQIKPLAKNRGACFATDMITVEGRKVGYMYREEADEDGDSGWRFMSGHESQDYMDDPDKHGLYDINTIANYDPQIIPLLDAPCGCAFERDGGSGPLVQIEGEPWQPGDKQAAPARQWPPPGFPLVEGRHPLTDSWSIDLPEPFARRIEEGSLVLWRPGLTIWLTAWNNDQRESQQQRLASIKQSASPSRFDEHEATTAGVTRYRYRLQDENDDGVVESIYGFILNDAGQLQASIYFDDPADEAKAQQLADSLSERRG